MPWLIKDENLPPDQQLFFVHVPRCGGTSLAHHFDIPTKVMEGRSCWGKFGMTLFLHRYKLLENVNFPIWTYGNAIALVLLAGSLFCASTQFETHIHLWGFSIFLAFASFVFFFFLSFVFTAPTIGRIVPVRRSYLLLNHYVLCQFMESIDWCTGTNRTGYMMHLTAHKLLAYQYIPADVFDQVCTMAIVRNPYSRMVSMYNYNRFGKYESFEHFVKSWYNTTQKPYRVDGEMDEWYTPCHAIPQFEYTHYQGKQLVQSIVKQEELKFLKTIEDTPKAIQQDSSVADLPTPVRDALLGMPHTNARKTDKKWYEYYTQETLDLTYEMYKNDFDVFKYSPALEQRNDLQPPALYQQQQRQEQFQQQQQQGEAKIAEDEDVEAPPPPSRPQLEPMLRNSSRSSQEQQSLRSNLIRTSSEFSSTTTVQRLSSGRGNHHFHSTMVGPHSQRHLEGDHSHSNNTKEKKEAPLETTTSS